MRALSRVWFALRHRTFGRKVVCPSDAEVLFVYHAGETVRLRRRCPHQGAPLETGYFDGDCLVCPWHGCRFRLARKSPTRATRTP